MFGHGEAEMEQTTCAGCGVFSTPSERLGRGFCKKRCYKKYVRSRNVYENKQISDKMPGKKSDIYV
jgi:hypothetical protein